MKVAHTEESNARMSSILLDNFQRDLRNKRDTERYLDENGDFSATGRILFAIQGAFETIGRVFGGTAKL